MSILRCKIALRLSIGEGADQKLLPVSSAVMSYAINEVPTCSVQLPLGFAASSDTREKAVTDEVLSLLSENLEVRLLAIIEGSYTESTDWNSEAQVIFDGRLNNVADSITRGAGALNLTFQHWLGDLMSSSILMSYAHPLVNANIRDLVASYGKDGYSNRIMGSSLAGIGQLADTRSLTENGISNDLWSNGVKELIADLVTNPLDGLPQLMGCEDEVNRASPKLIRALARMEGTSTNLGRPLSKWAVPLALGGAEGNTFRRPVLQAMANFITSDKVGGYLTSDAWTKIVRNLGPRLGFVVVPRVDSAIVAPYLPNLRTPYCHRIVADDIVSVDTADPVRSTLRMLGVFHKRQAPFGNDGLGRSGLPYNNVCYSPTPAPESGKTRFIKPPEWLDRIASMTIDSKRDFRGRNTKGGVSNPASEFDVESDNERNRTFISANDLLYQYARMKYGIERLQGRSAKVVGKLRFDISPGSTVEVVARRAQFRGLEMRSPNLQGYVSRVTISMDANRKVAMTLFQLQHTRTLVENEKDEITMEAHPVYAEPFYGATLLDGYENEECPEDSDGDAAAS